MTNDSIIVEHGVADVVYENDPVSEAWRKIRIPIGYASKALTAAFDFPEVVEVKYVESFRQAEKDIDKASNWIGSKFQQAVAYVRGNS
jgi:hypothetical protein